MKKLSVVVIGATGAAGQNVVESLRDHPWFEIGALAASRRSEGLTYRDATREAVFFKKTPSEDVLNMKVLGLDSIFRSDYDIAFSALPSDVARDVEPEFAKYIPVISTASAYRYEPDVPILIPEVNGGHAELLKNQQNLRGWGASSAPDPTARPSAW